ncbi:MAG TPA: BON domain-containing protein [Terriglobales bacterium]
MKLYIAASALALTLAFAGCNTKKTTPTTSVNNEQGSTQTAATGKLDDSKIKDALQKANLNDVKVDVDNDNRVVKLNGNVQNEDQRTQAEQIAKANSNGFVVANQIGLRPQGENNAGKVSSKTDDAIKDHLKALEARNNNWGGHHIRTDVKNGVVTLKGDVDTMQQHDEIERAAANVPEVRQVVNQLQVKQASQ